MSSALEGYPWEPRPGEPQCESRSAYMQCQLPAEHTDRAADSYRSYHFYDLGDSTYSWPVESVPTT